MSRNDPSCTKHLDLPWAGPLAAPLTLAAILVAGPALASSDDAWEAFRAEVQSSCTALAEAPEGAKIMVEVSPFGSESYGAALVTVGLPDGGADRMICIMDKASRKAEIAAPFTPTEGEGAARGGGMGKAEAKGATAGDMPPPPAGGDGTQKPDAQNADTAPDNASPGDPSPGDGAAAGEAPVPKPAG